MLIDLHLKTTEEQRIILGAWLAMYSELCERLHTQAPPELQRFKQLYYWAFHRLLRWGASPLAAEMITGKVSSCRTKGKPLQGGGILFQDRMMQIDLAQEALLLPVVKVVTKEPSKYSKSKRVNFDWLAIQFEGKEKIPRGKITGGLLVDDGRGGYLFRLRVEPLLTGNMAQ